MPNLQGKIELIKQAQVDIKNAIIDKGVTPTGNISTYADAIDNIVTPNNQTKTVTENGVVRYDTGYTGLEQVTVNVNQSVQNKNITTNGTYTADNGYVGLGVVTVDVSPDVIAKTITANGTYNAEDDDVEGYSSVTVNVPLENQIFQRIDVYTTNIVAAFDNLGNTINVDNFVASCLLMFEKQSNLTNKFISGCIYIDGDAGQSYLTPAFSVAGESYSRRIISAYISPSNLYGSNYNCLITSVNELGAVLVDDLFLNLSVTV